MSNKDLLIQQYGNTVNPKKIAEVLGCHPSHVRAMCARGELPAVRIGSRWFIPTVKFAELLERTDGAN